MEEDMYRHHWGKGLGIVLALVLVLSEGLVFAVLPQSAEVVLADEVDSAALAEANSALSGYTNLGIAVVNSSLNIRKKATTSSAVVGVMKNHAACEIISTSGSWSLVQSGSVKGYVYNKYLATGEQARSIALNILLSGSLSTATAVKASSSASTRASLVSYALKFVGGRYVYGGTSLTKGVDCSGYTMQIYAKYGVKLPHSSAAQPSYGKKIKASNAQPGDLFFYGSGKKINHVGIYIGNGKIVHASNASSGIKISNAYYSTPICVVSYLD
jgi:cell wall-associated NlpC family hydrolase